MEAKNVRNDECIQCRRCTDHCSFLSKYGMTIGDTRQLRELAYHCFLCGKCTAVCPKSIDGRGLVLEMRKDEVKKNAGQLAQDGYGMLLKEKKNYLFQNYRRGKKKSVLFPGCSFPSFFPKTMVHLERIMKEHDIGVVYDCCRKPVYELGLTDSAATSIREIEQRLKHQGVEELVTMCPNCYYFMKDDLSIPVRPIYNKLIELNIGKMLDIPGFSLYYPCPDRADRIFADSIMPFLKNNPQNNFESVQCCGLGGCAAVKEPKLAKEMVAEAGKNDRVLYTYCASCISNFRRSGFMESYHVLPMILGVEEKVPLGLSPLFNRMIKKFK